MPKRISITPHLTVDELEQRYRQSTHPTERSHYQIIWLLAQGRPTEEVAAVTGYSRDWIYELVRSYNRIGTGSLGDLRRHNPGAAPKLHESQQAQLLEAVRGSAPDGGLWNGRKVTDYVKEVFGITITRQQGWVYFKQMEGRLRMPYPKIQETDLARQEERKKEVAAEGKRSQQGVSRRYRRDLGGS